MEQNLTERERKQRLVVGIAFALAAAVSYIGGAKTAVVILFAVASIGFMTSYFTCFCGTKKIICELRSKLGG